MPSFEKKKTTMDKVPQNNPKDELIFEEFTDESDVEITSNGSSKQKVDDDDDDDDDNSNNKMKIIIML